jgi:hypothetical protein
MPRRPFAVAIGLLAGVLLNLAIAWACAAWMDTTRGKAWLDPVEPDASRQEIRWIQQRFGHTRVNRIVPNGEFGSLWFRPKAWRDAMRHGADGGSVSQSEDYAGWPLPALMSVNQREVGSSSNRIAAGLNLGPAYGVTGGIELRPYPTGFDGESWRALPCQPVWLGAIVNTLFYATLMWLVATGFCWVRRAWRRRHGLCAACGYDQRGKRGAATRCPECGFNQPA